MRSVIACQQLINVWRQRVRAFYAMARCTGMAHFRLRWGWQVTIAAYMSALAEVCDSG